MTSRDIADSRPGVVIPGGIDPLVPRNPFSYQPPTGPQNLRLGDTDPARDNGLESRIPLSQYPKAEEANPRTLRVQVWERFDISRPTILWPSSSTVFPNGIIFYTPNRLPTAAATTNALRSVGQGVIFLSNPGTWWVFNSGSVIVQVLQVDASIPSVAARYLAEPGSHLTTRSSTTVSVASVQILARNRDRKSATVVNGTGGAVWVTVNEVAAVNAGVRLSTGGSITFSGDTLTRERLFAIRETADSVVTVLETI